MALKNMWGKKTTTRNGTTEEFLFCIPTSENVILQNICTFPSQACKNIFWEVGKLASAGEAVHKTSLQTYSKNHVLETISIDSIFH